jgi:hypothetical protein
MPEQRSSQWYAGNHRNAYIHRAWMRRGLDVAPEDLRRREPPAAAVAGYAAPARGCRRFYVDHVLQADQGADLDFLIGASGHQVTRESH